MMNTGPRRRPWMFRLIEYLLGVEYPRQFREDFKWVVIDHSGKFQRWQPPRRQLKSEAREGWQDATESNVSLVLFFLGISSFAASLFVAMPAAQLISVLSIVVAGLAALHKTSVDILLYYPPYNTRNYDYLKFQSAWNRGPMNSWKASLILIVGSIMKRNAKLYNLGLWIVEDFTENS